MHIRTKKWARPELGACPFFTAEGEQYRGRWRSLFGDPDRPLHLEMGCGKGVSTAKMAAANPGVNYVVTDISADVLGDTRRNIVRECGERPDNIMILLADITEIGKFFSAEDGAERIIIQFPNPWTERPKHEKRRLTHPRQLLQYREFLKENGEIHFKTDDDTLFEDSRVYFAKCGFREVFLTRDLQAAGYGPNYPSEHELKYTQLGVPIKFAVLRMEALEESFDPTRYRLTPGVRRETLRRLDEAPAK